MSRDTLNASEALFGFAGWLTSRDESTILGCTHDAAVVADLVQAFIDENNLPEVREDWCLHLTHPSGEVATVEKGQE